MVDQIPSRRAVAAREALANWLRNGHGIQHVVFAPLPPVHHFPGLPQPLRWVAGSDARRHNAALTEWAATRGDVSRVDMEMPLNRGVMARDGFHPGEPVYRYCANAIAQHIATHVWPHLHLHPHRTVGRTSTVSGLTLTTPCGVAATASQQAATQWLDLHHFLGQDRCLRTK